MFEIRETRNAIVTAVNVVAWPLGVADLVLFTYEVGNVSQNVALLIVGLALVIGISVVVGIAIGLAAHRLFANSGVPIGRMSAAMGLLFDFVVIGWLLEGYVRRGIL